MPDTKGFANSVEQFADPAEEAGLIQMIADGATNPEITAKYCWSIETITAAISTVMERRGVTDRTSLVYGACLDGTLVVGRKRCAPGVLEVADYERERGELLGRLSWQQAEVLPLVAEGLTNGAIGRRLKWPEFTVKYHLYGALRVLDARNRTNVVYKACVSGVLPWGNADA